MGFNVSLGISPKVATILLIVFTIIIARIFSILYQKLVEEIPESKTTIAHPSVCEMIAVKKGFDLNMTDVRAKDPNYCIFKICEQYGNLKYCKEEIYELELVD